VWSASNSIILAVGVEQDGFRFHSFCSNLAFSLWHSQFQPDDFNGVIVQLIFRHIEINAIEFVGVVEFVEVLQIRFVAKDCCVLEDLRSNPTYQMRLHHVEQPLTGRESVQVCWVYVVTRGCPISDIIALLLVIENF